MLGFLLGEVVGSYRVTAKLSEGGMGVVYRAEHQLLGKPAAVKVLLPELSNNREIVNRFFNEARAATAVRHPGIVEIFDFGYLPTGMAYIVMELLDGEPLSRRLASRGRVTEREALNFTRGIASSLAAAHAQGIVHRDLKPDNIFLCPDPDMPGGERTKLLDFGIAKIAEAQRAGGAASKTRTGAVLGTPTYMSPEQCKGAGEVDHRSDLYSLGCILYEMVVGRPPFQAEGIGEIIGAHLYAQPVPPSQAGAMVSEVVEHLVMQLLQKRPDDRVQSAQELARMLGQGSLPQLGQAQAQTVMSATPIPVTRTPVPMRTPAPVAYTAPGAVGQPTTLSSAAGGTGGTVAEAPKKSKAPLFAAIGLFVVGGGVAAVVLGGGGGKQAADPAPVPAVGSPGSNAAGSAAGSAGSGSAAGANVNADSGSAVAAEVPDAGALEPDAAAVAEIAVDAGVAAEEIDAGTATASSRHRDRDRRDRDRTNGTKPGDKPDGSTSAGSGSGSGSSSVKINRGD